MYRYVLAQVTKVIYLLIGQVTCEECREVARHICRATSRFRENYGTII